MTIPRYARYEYCNEKACEFLEKFNITNFPINVEAIIHINKWGLVSYSELMSQLHCNRPMVIQCLGSTDGFTLWDGYNYTISYNDDESLGARTRFTLMHEIGHIYLNHLKDFESTRIYRGSLTKEENYVLECEANVFARNVLMPEEAISKMTSNSPNVLSPLFGVSYSAASTRLNFLDQDRANNNRAKILYGYILKFEIPSIGDIFADSNATPKYCCICGTAIYGFDVCMICGYGQKKGVAHKMKYKEYETDPESGRLKYCISCGNEDVLGDFCHICGKPVVNYCTDAKYGNPDDIYEQRCQSHASLPGNARYCIHCGNASTFLRHNLLIDYKKERSGNDSEFMIIPDPEDEELPFN